MTNKGYTPVGGDGTPKPPKGGTGESKDNLIHGRNGPPPPGLRPCAPLPPPPPKHYSVDINITHRYENSEEKSPKPEAVVIGQETERESVKDETQRDIKGFVLNKRELDILYTLLDWHVTSDNDEVHALRLRVRRASGERIESLFDGILRSIA